MNCISKKRNNNNNNNNNILNTMDNTNTAIRTSMTTGASSYSGGGNEYGGSVSFATPVYSSGSNAGDYSVTVGAGRSGSWTSDNGALYSVGAGVSFKTW
jgi:hypothetical protein